MNKFNWNNILKELKDRLFMAMDKKFKTKLEPEILKSNWLGYPSARESEIKIVEDRIGTTLPPSYREFLKVSNGWYKSDWNDLNFWSTKDIDWFCVKNQNIIEGFQNLEMDFICDRDYFVYGEEQDRDNIRVEYLQTALQISNEFMDSDFFLLIPDVINIEGEWEAWYLCLDDIGGAYRYQSFYDLVNEYLINKYCKDLIQYGY